MIDLGAIRKAASECLDRNPTWAVVEDECNGKDEAYCHWHRVGPFSLMGEKPDDDGKYLALLDPATVLAMVKVCEVVRALTPGDSTLPAVDGFVPVPFDRFLALSDALRALTSGAD